MRCGHTKVFDNGGVQGVPFETADVRVGRYVEESSLMGHKSSIPQAVPDGQEFAATPAAFDARSMRVDRPRRFPKRNHLTGALALPGGSTLERELAEAIELYKKTSGRVFPTWSEILEVLRALGYHKPEQECAGA